MGACIRNCLFDANLTWWKIAVAAGVIIAAAMIIGPAGPAATAILIRALATVGIVLAIGVIACLLRCILGAR